MNVSGPRPAIPPAYRLPATAPGHAARLSVEVGHVPAPPGAPSGTDPAPPGSDPALWSILTTEERRYFAQQAALGPIHYGPRSAAPAPNAPLGGRIDVRG